MQLTLPLGAEWIMRLLPHRPPFLLIDQVINLEPGQYGIGVKNISINEPYFIGHFPNEPIVPGVLIIESLAQLTAVVYASEALLTVMDSANDDAANGYNSAWSAIQNSIGYLAAVQQFKFLKPVRPGEQLILEAKMGSALGFVMQVKVLAKVGREKVAEGTLTVTRKS